MKRLILVVALALLVVAGGTPVFADVFKDTKVETTSEKWCHSHNYEVEETVFDVGIGADIKLVDLKSAFKQNFLDSINAEYRFSGVNKNHSAYLVVNVDLASIIQK